MEYSLKTLNENSDLKDLQTHQLIERLNLIGFEVDGIMKESVLLDSFEENLKLLIKIPANREDLLNEKLFLIELSNLFWLKLHQPWEDLKKKYYFLSKQIYLTYVNYQSLPVESDLSDLFLFQLPIEVNPNFISPLWVQEKLVHAGFPVTNSIQDLLKVTHVEWGQTFNSFEEKKKEDYNKLERTVEMVNNERVLQIQDPSNSLGLADSKALFSPKWIIEKLTEPQKFLSVQKIENSPIEILLEKNTIVLKNEEGLIQTVFGLEDLKTMKTFPMSSGKILFLQTIFYDIYENTLSLASVPNKISFRYLRQQYLEYVRFSFQRLLTLVEITKAGKILSTVSFPTNVNIQVPFRKILRLDKKFLTSTLNINAIDFNMFVEAGLVISCETTKEIYFSVPTYRKDLERPIDLVEEYSRYVGYDNFPPIFPTKINAPFQSPNKNIQLIKQLLLNAGFQEILTNPLQESKKEELNSVFLQNPLNSEFSLLRNTLLDKILSVFEMNSRLASSQTNFFEIGRIFLEDSETHQPIEKDKVAGVFQSNQIKKGSTPTTEWFMARGIIESFLHSFGINDFSFETKKQEVSFFHPKKSILIKRKGKILGFFGEINPKIDLKLKNLKYPLYIFEFDVGALNSYLMKSSIPLFEEYSKYPVVSKDISFLAKKKMNFLEMQTLLKRFQLRSKILKRFQIFDLYFEEQKNQEVAVGIRLFFQSKVDTLTSQEIDLELHLVRKVFLENFDVKLKD